MIRIMIVEDNTEQRAYISQEVHTILKKDASIVCYDSAEKYYLQPELPVPDIAILDIQLPGDSGIQLATLLNQSAPYCQILYLSSFVDYAVDVYKTTLPCTAFSKILLAGLLPDPWGVLGKCPRTSFFIFSTLTYPEITG